MPANLYRLAAAVAPSADSDACDLDSEILDDEGGAALDTGADVETLVTREDGLRFDSVDGENQCKVLLAFAIVGGNEEDVLLDAGLETMPVTPSPSKMTLPVVLSSFKPTTAPVLISIVP